MNVNTNYGINNNNAGPQDELAARLAQWTPEGQPNLDFILTFYEHQLEDINNFLIKAAESTHFDKNELKEVVYKMLNSLRIGSPYEQRYKISSFTLECSQLDSKCLFQFLNITLINLELDLLKSQPFSEIKSSQIINLCAKKLLAQKLSFFFNEKFLHNDFETKIPPAMETRYMAADIALREKLFIPTELTYQNIENDPLTQEDKERVYGEVRKDMPTAIFRDFDEYIKSQPDIQSKKEEIWNTYQKEINSNPNRSNIRLQNLLFSRNDEFYNEMIRYTTKMCEDHFETKLQDQQAQALFDGIKNAANKDI